jgi:DNA-binding Lrp family transcriptional regulator
MSASPIHLAEAEASAASDFAIARVVTRLSGEYVLRAFQLTIDAFGDVRAGLLLQAINNANIAGMIHKADGRRVAGPAGIYPDEARRPVSIARLADSAGVPFESARRIVRRLIADGACEQVEGGLIVPSRTLERPPIACISLTTLGYVRRFVRDLEAVGLVEEAPPAERGRGTEGDEAGVALASRIAPLSNEYVLRALQLLGATYGDVRLGIVAQTIVTANTAHLDGRGGEGWRYAGIDEAPPDAARKPVSVARLAESLGVAYETMRGQVRRLTAAGVCIRVAGGLVVPQAVLETPAATRATLTNVDNVRKFVRAVQTIGLGEAAVGWRREAEGALSRSPGPPGRLSRATWPSGR